MATLTMRSTGVLRSTFYLKGGNALVPGSGSLYPPLRVNMLDSGTRADLSDSGTRVELADSATRVDMRT